LLKHVSVPYILVVINYFLCTGRDAAAFLAFSLQVYHKDINDSTVDDTQRCTNSDRFKQLPYVQISENVPLLLFQFWLLIRICGGQLVG
jgi:hypothetical protein